MDLAKRERIFSYDLIRFIGALFVVSVHSIWYSGYYTVPVEGFSSFIILITRNLICCSLPLFLFLTGCLMKDKKPSKMYYFGLFRIYLVYFLCAGCCVLGGRLLYGLPGSFWSILNFSATPYGWYINMYMGLYLLIPFLNVWYRSMTKRQKEILIITLVILTAVPCMFNLYDGNTAMQQIFPDWWMFLYPIMFYMMGLYQCDYEIKVSKKIWIIVLVSSVLLETVILYAINGGGIIRLTFGDEIGDKRNLFSVINGLCIFQLLKDVHTEKKAVKKFFGFFSKVTFEILLISILPDYIFYVSGIPKIGLAPLAKQLIGEPPANFLWLFVSIPVLFLITGVLSWPISFFADFVNRGAKRLFQKLIVRKKEEAK